MALISYNEVGISGIAAAVPSKVINNINYDLYFKKEDIKDIYGKLFKTDSGKNIITSMF